MFSLLFPAKEMTPARRSTVTAPDHAAPATLDRLPQGASGKVRSIGGPSTALRQRLMELGITIGSEIRVIRKAPFGGPIEISVRGYRLSLRRTEAHIVTVARLD